MFQLPVDCLDEIFEYLEEDLITLHSCLLVNRLWCKVSVRILWRNSLNYNVQTYSTLVACLPKESKEILSKSGIIILTPTSKPPMFNYASYCKVLSINHIFDQIRYLFKNQSYKVIEQEIYRLHMSQITSLKELKFMQFSSINFTLYPGSKDCLKNLSKLNCSSNDSHEIFYQLSHFCHNLSSLKITIGNDISNGLIDLISVQKNLKDLGIIHLYDCDKDIISTLSSLSTNLPDTLIKLQLYRRSNPLSFIAKFTILQELILSFNYTNSFEGFEILQYIRFPQLQILKIRYSVPKYELLIKFLEINGRNLKEIYLGDLSGESENSLNLVISKFCINLRVISVGFKNYELETLEIVFNNCKYLERIYIWCGGKYLSEKEALDAALEYSRENIFELTLYHLYDVDSKLLPEELESFFMNWTNRIQPKSLSLTIVNNDDNSLHTSDENMKIIEKYTKLGVIKTFKVTDFEDDEFN
ncbi:hypothetical protein C1645_865948 [Glomus cerebriforme]|uniref:F-box domain-containing protein n=1 Tax=Glomus cerebriforme TaxID=658196 RepID=A0A397S9A4_9GLOM|nr:hypothetical protein C1645_865948 [Glomus cerebriforme]